MKPKNEEKPTKKAQKPNKNGRKTADLRVFVPRPPEVNQAWVLALEDALSRAKSGETVGGAVIESTQDTVRHEFTGLKNKFEFAGLLQRLLHAIMN